MTDFRNAYHFVPRKPPLKSEPDKPPVKGAAKPLPKHQRDQGLGCNVADGHAAYAPGTHSGRITLRITLESGTVVGGTRHNGEGRNRYSLVEPFLFKELPAMPATSLKGMLSLIVEVASRAPYRVLSDEKLTVAWSPNKSTRYRYYEGAKDGPLSYVHDHVPPESRPLTIHAQGPRRVTRGEVNPAEVMFGYIRQLATAKGPEASRTNNQVVKGTPVSAAGKLRISHALPSGSCSNWSVRQFFLQGDLQPWASGFPPGLKLTRLKEQGTPMKRPKRGPGHGDDPDDFKELRSATPNFYFMHVDNPGAFVSKPDFAASPDDYLIKGTKFYLHHPDAASEPWKTGDIRESHRDLARKAAVAVLKPGVTFDFDVDFDNLSDHELNILCFALQPSPRFRHKIGLGRALGLGSISIEPQGMTLIDRSNRYQAQAVFEADPRAKPLQVGLADFAVRAAAHSTWLQNNDPTAKAALLAIGETHVFGEGPHLEGADTPVLWVPLVEEKFANRDEAAAEANSFKWFVENDKDDDGWKEPLGPIVQEDWLPTLTTDGSTPKLAPLEIRGKIKVCQRDKAGALYAIIATPGKPDVFANQDQCKAAGITPNLIKADVVYRQGPPPGNAVASVRRFYL